MQPLQLIDYQWYFYQSFLEKHTLTKINTKMSAFPFSIGHVYREGVKGNLLVKKK